MVPIKMDDPYSYDKTFVTNLVVDLYGEQFSFTNSMLWLGEHVDEDPQLPRILGFTRKNNSPLGFEGVGVSEDVVFSEIGRFSALWMGYETESGVSDFQGVPFAYELEEYTDIVSGWATNSQGISRLIVGMVHVFRIEILSPSEEQADLYFERFFPIHRFYNEGQSLNYAQDLANVFRPLIDDQFDTLANADIDCSVYPSGNQRQLCFCLTTIDINFEGSMDNCVGAPLGSAFNTGIRTGVGGVAGVGIWSKITRRATGAWGYVAGGVAGFVGGFAGSYGAQYTQCVIAAKSTRDAAVNHAMNAFNEAEANGEDFSCPTGPR